MTMWEYLDDQAWAEGTADPKFQDYLDRMGAKGWELVGLVKLNQDRWRILYRLVWKRPKKNLAVED